MGSPAVTPDQSGTMGAPAPDQQSAPTPQDAGVQPAPAPQVGPPAAPPAAPAQPGNKWANIVKGALSGLALGGAPGFVAGAIAPTATRQALKNEQSEGTSKAQQAAANVRFTDAQAASLQKDTAIRQIQAENQTKDTQLAIQKNDEEMANSFMARGAQPVIVTDGAHPEAFQAGLKSLTDASGAVPSLVTFHVGDKLMSFDVSQLSQNPAILQTVNKMRAVQGLPAMASSTWNNAKMLPVAAKTKMITDSAHFLNPVPESDPDKLKNQTYQYQNFLTAAKGMEDTPDKADTVAKLTAAVKTLQNAPGASGPTEKEKSQIRVGTAIAGVRGAAFNNSKILPVLDESGNLTFARAGDALKRGIAPAGEGVKANSKQAQLGDIQNGLQTVRADVGKLDTPFSPSQVSQLALALHSTDPGVIRTNIEALNNQNLTSDQKQFVVDVAQLHERALSLRSVAGMGQGSDTMRAAIVRMLPSAGSGDREMMTKQLDAMDKQVQILGGGIPHVKGGNAGATPGGSQAAPKFNVGDTVNYQGKPHKVTGIDAKTGKIKLTP